MDELYNIEAEQALVGSLLIDPQAVERAALLAQPDDFHQVEHRVIYAAMLDLAARGDPLDILVIADELNRRGHLEQIGGMVYLTELLTVVPSALNTASYARIVHDLARRRRLVEMASQLARSAHDSAQQVDDVLDRVGLGVQRLVSPAASEMAMPLPDVAPLPMEFDPAEGEGAGAWLDQYVDYALHVAPMTPRLFHESAGLWLISVAIARRLVLPLSFGNKYPSLWIAWLAPTTLWTKTTALDVVRRIARQTVPFLIAPNEITPEAMISDMSGTAPTNQVMMTLDDQQMWQLSRNHAGQRGWSLDEFSGLLASAGRDYNAGLLETLLLLYDCSERYTRLTQSYGMQTIRQSYLSMLCASTPTALALHLTSERLWGMGWWPRFALLTPAQARPEWCIPHQPANTAAIASLVTRLYERLPEATWPEPAQALTVLFADGVYELWMKYNRALRYDLLDAGLDHRLWGAYGRLPVTVLKVATLLAAMDWTQGDAPAPRIERAHLVRAMTIAEQWRESVHRVLLLATIESEDRLKQRVLYQVARRDVEGTTLRDLYKAMRGIKMADLRAALLDLVDAGEVLFVERVTGPRGGRPTDRYYLAHRYSSVGSQEVLGT